MGDYASYESKFMDLWGRWIALLRPGEVALDFLKKERLWPSLSEKVRKRFPTNYEEAIEVAHLKDKKLHLQAQTMQPQKQEEGAKLVQQQTIVPTQHNQLPVEEETSATANDQQELLN